MPCSLFSLNLWLSPFYQVCLTVPICPWKWALLSVKAEKSKQDLKSKDVQIKKLEDTINGLDLKTKEKDFKYKILQDKVVYRLSETIATSLINQLTNFSFFIMLEDGSLVSLFFR
jgi:hypothetical protein